MLSNDNSIDEQSHQWFKNLNKYFHQSFRKIRNCKVKKKLNELDLLLKKRTDLVQKLKRIEEDKKQEVRINIEKTEMEISDLSAKENRNKIVENFSQLADIDGATNQAGVWAIHRKIFPKNCESLPFAKQNMDGKIVSSQKELKTLYLETFSRRLRHRPMKQNMEYLKQMKEELCSKRLEIARNIKSKSWNLDDLMKILSSLKDGKSRDPHGLINEIFKPGVGGKDFQLSFLQMANLTKMNLIIPKFMQYADIVSIYKGKGSKMDLDNDRGIFIVNLFRSIIMKMVYKDKYKIVDENMSDSNVGARKSKNIRNHIFVLNGVINEAVNNKKLGIDIEILDYKQCFDSMWMEECINDLWEAGIKDDNLALIYEMNKEVKVKVKTPFGFTKSESLERIIMQGETFGPLCCSVQVDSFGKECILKEKLLYTYKGEVGVPPLAMVDDLVCISECGVNSVLMNAFINAKTNIKKLQFGVNKCQKMHVGANRSYCPELKVDKWEVKLVENFQTSEKALEDEFVGEHVMEESENEKYLGDYISNKGNNQKNIEARKAKGVGVINQLMGKLEGTVYGPYYFEVALILRRSHLISSILTNCEAWYGLSNADIEHLEQIDEMYLRRVLEVGGSCPKEMLYLETGTTPIRFIIKFRRLMFLHYILNEKKDSLIHRCFDVQKRKPSKNDWILSVYEDLEELDIMIDFEQIKSLSNYQLKAFLKKIIGEKALSYLNKIKSNHSKVLHIEHKKLDIQEYLQPMNVVNIQSTKFLFLARTGMIDLKVNFRNKFRNYDLNFPLKCDEKDSQHHRLHYKKIQTLALSSLDWPAYDHLNSDQVLDKFV